MKINRRFTSALVLVMLLAQWAQAANELRYHGTPGATVKACIKTGATRWNNSAFVAPSTISDGSWTTGMVSMTELSTSSSTATGEFVGSIPAGVLTAIGSTLTVLDIDYYESTPTPSTARDAAQSLTATSSGVGLPATTSSVSSISTLVTTINDIVSADRYIVKTTAPNPYKMRLIKAGTGTVDTGTVLLEQELRDVNGTAIRNMTTAFGQSKAP